LRFSSLDENRHDTLPQLAMTPMIDVVFLLIVFFLTVKFAERTGELQARLPKAQGVIPRLERTEALASPEVWIKISPAKSGMLIPQGQMEPLDIQLNARPCKDFEDLHYELEILLARIRQDGSKPVVVMDLAGDLLYQSVVSAINVARQAGIEDLNFTPPTRTLAR
jgi:biopolymer transport protein ExbD